MDNNTNSKNLEINPSESLSTNETDNISIISSKEETNTNNNHNSNSDSDWVIKCIIIWVLPIIGGLIYMNDNDDILRVNARRSLVSFGGFIIISSLALAGQLYLLWIGMSVYSIILMTQKKTYSFPLVDDLVRNIWK